ncbi:MAG: hypothetical protein ACRYGM_03255, partial [Janthinobacterium lividum]
MSDQSGTETSGTKASGTDTFDEAWYLETFRDVRDAVAGGAFRSGEDHYRQFGQAEGRPPSAAADLQRALAAGQRAVRV